MAKPEPSAGTAGRVLVVDDQDDARGFLSLLLKMRGFDVVSAESGRRALDVLAETPVDVILLDVMMPEMDGFEVCRELQKSPATAAIPVILLTARDDLETRAQGMGLGVADYLTKPVNRHELLERLRTQVSARRRQRELEELERRAAKMK